MNYSDLLIEYADSIDIIESYIKKPGTSGLCFPEGIVIEKNLDSNKEKSCVLAEELGHYHTTVGNILNQKKVENRKQEQRAHAWGYEKLLPIRRIVSAYECGCDNAHEIAEFAEVTEKFLHDALRFYSIKYGDGVRYGNYVVKFDPLQVRMSFKD